MPLALLNPLHAAEEFNWSSGLYRTDPGRNPFVVEPREQRRPPAGEQWWDQERPTRQERDRERERVVPRIWESEPSRDPPARGHRPWGEIPRAGDERDPEWRERPMPRAPERLHPDDERLMRRPRQGYAGDEPGRYSDSRDRYWDGPYQSESYSRDRYYERDGDAYQRDAPPWWAGRRGRYDTRHGWDPWERDNSPNYWER
ncbi:MAG: hypothetical protein HQL96_13635 [Magnetococcales bacterium]|nr:hypothetical protein [Magnetococcales bacterium]